MKLKKISIETLKNLKIEIKKEENVLNDFYTPDYFNPNNLIKIQPSDLNLPTVSDEIVPRMCDALRQNTTEFEAGKILYENLKFLKPAEAADIGFWTYLNHFPFYSYIAQRWPALFEEEFYNKASYVLDHWVQTNSSQSDLMRFSLSGMWWSFYLTVDEENEEDKYSYTKTFFKNDTLRTRTLGTAKFARHRPAIQAVLDFIMENDLEEKSMEDAGRAIVPYINLLGGIRPLNYFSKDWFKEKLNKKFGEMIRKGQKLEL